MFVSGTCVGSLTALRPLLVRISSRGGGRAYQFLQPTLETITVSTGRCGGPLGVHTWAGGQDGPLLGTAERGRCDTALDQRAGDNRGGTEGRGAEERHRAWYFFSFRSGEVGSFAGWVAGYRWFAVPEGSVNPESRGGAGNQSERTRFKHKRQGHVKRGMEEHSRWKN